MRLNAAFWPAAFAAFPELSAFDEALMIRPFVKLDTAEVKPHFRHPLNFLGCHSYNYL
jgi:hypothetical protein